MEVCEERLALMTIAPTLMFSTTKRVIAFYSRPLLVWDALAIAGQLPEPLCLRNLHQCSIGLF